MPSTIGRNIPLSLPRRFVCDLVHFSRKVPTVPVQRRMNLGALVAARAAAMPRPSWSAIFLKAYALVAATRPELGRAYLSFPRPHLYEHPVPIASVAIERPFVGEMAVFHGLVRKPGQRGLIALDAKLRFLKEGPIQEVASFRRLLKITRLPRPIRRLVWWLGLNVFGRKRANLMGTFAFSAYSGLGASSLHPLSPLTTTLNYGVIEPDGTVDVRLIYDHRVLDGATVARALHDLESVLTGPLLAELHNLRAFDGACVISPLPRSEWNEVRNSVSR